MTQEGRQVMQPGRWVQPVAIPAQQTSDRKGVPEIVQPRRRNTLGDSEFECGHQVMEHLAGGARMHAAAPVEAEQRRVVAERAVGAAACELLGDQLADARAVRDEAGLAELAAPHDQQIPSRSTSPRRSPQASPARSPSP